MTLRRIAWILPASTMLISGLISGCSLVPSASQPTDSTAPPQPSTSTSTSAKHAAISSTKDPPGSPAPASSRNPTTLPTLAHAANGGPAKFLPTGRGRLDGKVILVDPGHNGGNFAAALVINRLICNGRESETCDTTGAETDAGYTEALFNWRVALYLTADLRAAGATVVLTRTSDTGVGPCVTERAAIGNEVHANAAVSIHADGGPPAGRFAILEPVAAGSTTPSSDRQPVSSAPTSARRSPPGQGCSTTASTASSPRDDLAGINLPPSPVFIEAGMRGRRAPPW